jgi:hypothetical protein
MVFKKIYHLKDSWREGGKYVQNDRDLFINRKRKKKDLKVNLKQFTR